MMTATQKLLEEWPERWRFPDLVAALNQGQNRGDHDLAMLIVRGLANPRTESEVAEELIRRGEFVVAEELLRHRDGAKLSAEDADRLDGELQRARRAAIRRLDARIVALRARAREADVEIATPENMPSTAGGRFADAESALDDLEAEVASAERAVAAELSGLLQENESEDTDAPATTARRSAVQRCIELGQFGAARTLLSSAGLDPASPQDSRTVPRRPPFPWRLPVRELLTWFVDPQAAHPPSGFFSSWNPADDDSAAHALLGALTQLVESDAIDSSAAVDLAHAIDAIAAGPNAEALAATQAVEQGSPTLYAFDDDWLKPLALFAAQPVTLIIGADSERLGDIPENAVAFFLEEPEVERPNCPVLTATALLGLLADREHRRVHLLRALCCQLPWNVALGAEAADNAPRLSDPAELANYVDWLLDLLNAEPEPAFSDVLVHSAGGRPDLAVDLLHEVLSAHAGRRVKLEVADVTIAADGPAFLDRAEVRLLGALDGASKAVFGALLVLAGSENGSVGIDDLHEALEVLWEATLTPQQLKSALQQLETSRLIEVREQRGHLQPVLAALAVGAVGDIEALITSAVDEV